MYKKVSELSLIHLKHTEFMDGVPPGDSKSTEKVRKPKAATLSFLKIAVFVAFFMTAVVILMVSPESFSKLLEIIDKIVDLLESTMLIFRPTA